MTALIALHCEFGLPTVELVHALDVLGELEEARPVLTRVPRVTAPGPRREPVREDCHSDCAKEEPDHDITGSASRTFG